jgi:hypothetical protein
MKAGRIRFSDLTFAVPGATVRLAGVYNVRTEQLDFRGLLRLQGTVSQTTTGFKRAMLKIIDPLFRKRDAGAEIPIKVAGNRTKPKFGLDTAALIPGGR